MTLPPLIPRSAIFGNPHRIGPSLSPDGSRLAYLAPHLGVLNVWVGPVDGNAGEARPVTDDDHRGIQAFVFAEDDTHLLYVRDEDGDENWRVHDVDLTTGVHRDLTPFDGVQAKPVSIDKRHPDSVLLGLNKDNPQLHDVYRLTLTTGELEKIAENKGYMGWFVDMDQRVRGAAAPTPEGGIAILVRDDEVADFSPVVVAGQEDALTTSPVAFTADGRHLYLVSSIGANTGRLCLLDLASGDTQVLAEDATYDVSGAMLHPDTRELQAVGFQRDRIEWEVRSDDIRADIDALHALHPGYQLGVVSRTRDDRRWIAVFDADDGPARYYLWDRDDQDATYLFSARPDLEEFELAPMQPFRCQAHDGLALHGYITFPKGERDGAPAVLNVHGGPWHRDAWGYGGEAQWLANRGYACVQVNFRGSTGYGKAFLNAGDREWGAAMHTDLLDALDHCAAQGWIDPDRVAIYGGSYGGYAALWGATTTPERFVCAVDIVGPSDLRTLIKSIPPYWAPMIKQFHTRIGHPDTDDELLWERSPLKHAGGLSIPLLIGQGANDPRVKQEESEQIVRVLEEKGIPHEYVVYEDEGHGFVKAENRLDFYARAEAFLAEHLGGRAEPPPSVPLRAPDSQ